MRGVRKCRNHPNLQLAWLLCMGRRIGVLRGVTADSEEWVGDGVGTWMLGIDQTKLGCFGFRADKVVVVDKADARW
jgi:hypothetical protein